MNGTHMLASTLRDVHALHRFLGPRMIYTSGIVSDLENEESLEQLQDTKMIVVCEKVCIDEPMTFRTVTVNTDL